MNEHLFKHYTMVWRAALRNLTNLSDQQIQEWCDRWEPMATAPNDDYADDHAFYHETPVYYITNLIIPIHLRDRLRGLDLVSLEDRLQNTIEKFAKPSIEQDIKKVPWDEVKREVDEIFREAEQVYCS